MTMDELSFLVTDLLFSIISRLSMMSRLRVLRRKINRRVRSTVYYDTQFDGE